MNIQASRFGSESGPSDQPPQGGGNPLGVQAGQPGEGEGPSIVQHYLRIAQRWRWLILGSIAACVALGLVATLLMTPQYTATATIEISREGNQVTNFEGVEREVSVSDQEFYQTQYGLLRARTLAERVAGQLGLIDNPEFFASYGVEGGEDPAFALDNGRYTAQGRQDRQRVAGEILLANINVEPARLSRLVDISFTGPDPAFAARVSNSWAENFIQSNLERKVQATSYGREQLQAQLADYKERLDESQRQLVTYASSEEIINLPAPPGADGRPQERSIVADDLAALNTALTEATADRIQAEARARQAGGGSSSTESLANQAINKLREKRADLAGEYQLLMVRFEPGYPEARALQSQIDEIDRAIAREEARVSGSLQGDYRAALEREQTLQARVNRLKADYLDLRRRSIQYNIYQQEVDTNRALYDGLLQRFKEIGVAGGVGVNNVSIIDPADVPQVPSSPNLLMNVLLSLIVGAGIGAALAFLLEQIDEAITDPTEVRRKLGLPLLGTIPTVAEGRPDEALLDRKSSLVDAYLAAFTNLGFTTEHGVPRSFAVTSTRPAEGKSTSSLALATTLARAGKSVILVDGDMRSPSVHQLGGVDHDRGLSNFLAGDDDIETMTFPMTHLGFTAMSAGPIPPNAAELLTGNRLDLLMRRLLEMYDHVVIDSPPVMGLADAPLIATHVEGVLYVVESHNIRAGLVKNAIGRLNSANIRIFGALLTKFEAKKSAYGYSYGYEYGYSYGKEDEGKSA